VLIFDSRPGVLLLNGHLGAPAFWQTSEGLGGCSGSPKRLVVAFDPQFVLGCAHILTLRSDAWDELDKTHLVGVPGQPERRRHGNFKREASADGSEYQYHLHPRSNIRRHHPLPARPWREKPPPLIQGLRPERRVRRIQEPQPQPPPPTPRASASASA
jgi:hypothetical protein